MFYYAFVLSLEFNKEVTIPDYNEHVNIPYSRNFPRSLHNRGSDNFSYKTPFISSKEEPYVDKMLDVFVDKMHKKVMKVKDYLKEKECEVSITILYDDNTLDDDEEFKGYIVRANTIKLLSEMDASLDYSSSIAKDILNI